MESFLSWPPPQSIRHCARRGAISIVRSVEKMVTYVPAAFSCIIPTPPYTSSLERDSTDPLPPRRILLCSAISKMTASIVTYPHEVVRTRLQTQKRPLRHDGTVEPSQMNGSLGGVIQTTKQIVTNEGWRALYRGLSINLVRTVPNSAVTMLT